LNEDERKFWEEYLRDLPVVHKLGISETVLKPLINHREWVALKNMYYQKRSEKQMQIVNTWNIEAENNRKEIDDYLNKIKQES